MWCGDRERYRKGTEGVVSSETGCPITHALVYGYPDPHGGWAQVWVWWAKRGTYQVSGGAWSVSLGQNSTGSNECIADDSGFRRIIQRLLPPAHAPVTRTQLGLSRGSPLL